MAQIANITLADGQATPANRTFVPGNPQGSSTPAIWFDKSPGNPVAFRRLTLKVEAKVNGISKVRIAIADPILASMSAGCCVDSNVPAVSYTDFCNVEFSIPSSSTLQNRKDILAYVKNFLATSVATSAVVDLEPAF